LKPLDYHPSADFARYLQTLALEGGLSCDQLAELEDHMLTRFEAELAKGADPTQAGSAELRCLGNPTDLSFEYRKTHAMSSLSRFLGIAITVAMLLLAVAPLSSLGSFVDVPSALLVGGLVLGGLVASFGPVAIQRALRQAFERRPSVERDVRESLRLARHGYRLSWAAGAVGVLVGSVVLLTNLGGPAQLGGGLAVAILSLLYGALLAELGFANLAQWLERGAPASELATH